MKLYTEEQLINTVNSIQIYIEKFGKDGSQPTIKNHLKMLAPIELPSDKEIEESSPHKLGGGNYNALANFYRYEGAKWMKEQIIKLNK